MRYVTLDAVHEYVTLDEQEYTDIYADTFKALSHLQIAPVLEHTAVTLEVDNYKTSLPKDVLKIRLVAVMNTQPSLNDFNSLCSECAEGDENEIICTGCTEGVADMGKFPVGLMEKQACRIRHQGITYIYDYYHFINSPFYKNNFDVMKPKRNYFTKGLLCATCESVDSTCTDTYEITPHGEILTSFESGTICIDYFKYATNEDGDFLIPDDPALLETLATYVMWKHWEARWNRNNQNAYQKMREYRASWFIKKKAYIGDVVMREYDPIAVNQLLYQDVKMARSPKVFNNRTHYLSRNGR